jgi:hypothetical protein
MSPIAIALVVFVCAFGGALVGMWLRDALPEPHLSADSKEVIGLGIGMIATMTALILGLMTASAKSAFDAKDAAVKHVAVTVLGLDRMLADYGPETKQIREILRQAVAARVETTWPEDASKGAKVDYPAGPAAVEGIAKQIADLSPQNPAQTWFQSRALDLSGDVLETRFTVFGDNGSSVSSAFLVVVVFWLTVIFGSFGLRAPRNATVIAVLIVCALSVAASVFLIMEMDTPFDGLMKISSAPLRFTLSHLGQ